MLATIVLATAAAATDGCRRDETGSGLVFQPTSSLQYVAGVMIGLLSGGWWRGFTLRHPAMARRER